MMLESCTSLGGESEDERKARHHRLQLAMNNKRRNNDLLKSHGIGNGSIARVRRVKLKSTATDPGWKNWEGKKVYCASFNDVEYIDIERLPESSKLR